MKVLYNCKGCGIKNRTVTVLERQDKEDIKAWVDRVAQSCGDDHCLVSLLCEERKIDLEIPLFEDAASIGMSGKEQLSPESMAALKEQLKHE